MTDEKTQNIKPNSKCKVIKESDVFFNKYGTSTPNIIIEDKAEVVFGGEKWWEEINNPAILSFLTRTIMGGINPESTAINVYYGKIFTKDTAFGIGELVWENEIELIG